MIVGDTLQPAAPAQARLAEDLWHPPAYAQFKVAVQVRAEVQRVQVGQLRVGLGAGQQALGLIAAQRSQHQADAGVFVPYP